MFGAGSCKLIRDDADWESAEETIKILHTGYSVVTELGGVQTGSFKTTTPAYLQPKTTQYIEISDPSHHRSCLALTLALSRPPLRW